MFQITYTLITSLVLLLFAPIILLLSLREKYKNSIPSRFFLFKNLRQPVEGSYWFHGCSLGEINAMKPFIEELQSRGESISITTTTDTGFNSAKSLKTALSFLPFEPLLYIWTRPQKRLIVLEAELWFLLFYVAKTKNIETLLWSARLSDRSFPRYKKMRWLYKRLFQYVDIIYAQSEIDRERFLQLGAKDVRVAGNIKLLKSKANREIEMPKDRLVVVGASTHKDDEVYILDGWHNYGKGRLILVPRHKERFNEVWTLIQEFNREHRYTLSRYSENKNFLADITLVDEIGLLVDIYNKSDVVILGGGFYDGIGGHNPVEPASFNNKIISGKYMFNQKELIKYISNLQIVDREELASALNNSENLPYSKIEQDIDFQKELEIIL